MKDGLKDGKGRYLSDVRKTVTAGALRDGIWAAVERYGVPYSTVRVWVAKTKQQEGKAEEVDVQKDCAEEKESEEAGTWRVHSPEEKAKAVADAETLGNNEAAEKHGVVVQTIRTWRRELAGEVEEAVEEAIDAPAMADPIREEPVDPEEWDSIEKKKNRATGVRYSAVQQGDAVADALEAGISEAARTAGVSRHTLYRWMRRTLQEAGEPPMERRWEQTEAHRQRDLEILHEWHKQPGLGPMQIRSQLRRRGVRTSVHTVRRVMEDNGYRPPKVVSHAHRERYEAIRPNHIWHLDFVHRHIHMEKTYTLIMLDDYSRFVTGHAVGGAEKADIVIKAFDEAVTKHGRPEAVMTDKGSAFWSSRGVGQFTRLLEEMGVDQLVPRSKEINGKVERFNLSLTKELFEEQRFDDVGRMQTALEAHLHWYNHERTHLLRSASEVLIG